MNHSILPRIAAMYCLTAFEVAPLQSGLINTTYKITTEQGDFILQQINTQIFKCPEAIDNNLKKIKDYLQTVCVNYLFVAPIPSINGKTLIHLENRFYRVFKYIPKTHTKTVVQNAYQAYEAAKQFAQFTFMLKGFDTTKLQTTLPDFHNLTFRYQQFKTILKEGNKNRINNCADLIKKIEHAYTICETYDAFIVNTAAQKRVTHHDTKISNVLFNEDNTAVCVIDLDTVMPGYFLSDVGDMIRTYVCPVSEEESDLAKIEIRTEILQAIKDGYLFYMNNELTDFEKQHFFFAGEMMIYMQALRFITDYFNNDTYYSIHYSQQNLVRATNQMHLLDALQKQLKNFKI
jgi:Ser/Thr protein kinase RdoA (MazF antagonist)